MSDARGTGFSYARAIVPAALAKKVHSSSKRIARSSRRDASSLSLVRVLGEKHGITQVARYQEIPQNLVADLLRDIRKHAIIAQAAGGVAAVLVSAVLLIAISVNGVVIALASFASGLTTSQLVVRYSGRKIWRARAADHNRRKPVRELASAK